MLDKGGGSLSIQTLCLNYFHSNWWFSNTRTNFLSFGSLICIVISNSFKIDDKIGPLLLKYLHLSNSAKLRARQKERLAQRNAIKESHPTEGLPGTESLMHPPVIAKDGDLGAGLIHSVQEGTFISIENNKDTQLSEAQNSNADSLSRIEKLSKYKMSHHFDVSVNNPGRSLPELLPPNYHNKGKINTTNSMPSNHLLPVLGLCAPNANQIESSEGSTSKLNWRQNRHGARQEFPFNLAPCTETSMDAEARNKEKAANTKSSDASTENLQQSFKNSIPDNFLPFLPVCSLNMVVDLLSIVLDFMHVSL